MTELVEQCAQLIDESENIVVLTGAGISTAAGIPDFRGPKGLYVTRQYDPETVFDINYFYHDPKPFFDFARDFVRMVENIKPTFTHYFLAELEKKGKLKGIITQNIDALHQRAGSQNVLEMHGSFWRGYCLQTHEEFSYEQMKEMIYKHDVPKSSCGGVIKPDIVFFGENVKYYAESFQLAEKADLFIIIGSSCVVQPAASLPFYTSGKVAIVNRDEVKLDLLNIAFHAREDIDQFFTKVAQCLELPVILS